MEDDIQNYLPIVMFRRTPCISHVVVKSLPYGIKLITSFLRLGRRL